MGLDVTAHQKFRPNPDGEHRYFPNPDFADIDQADGLPDARVDSIGEQFHFYSGYTAYSAWRNELATLMLDASTYMVAVRPKDFRNQPFFELICFADNHGSIGPTTSAKLAKDFVEHHAQVREFAASGRRGVTLDFLERYQNWMRAFQLAAGEGFVDFH